MKQWTVKSKAASNPAWAVKHIQEIIDNGGEVIAVVPDEEARKGYHIIFKDPK